LWDAFLHRIFGNSEALIEYVQRLIGYCLTGDVSEQILPIFWGTGANGKSTLVNIIFAMLGLDYSMKAPPDLLMVKRNESHPTERADLFGKRFVACIETDEHKRLAESLVKDLTGGDRLRARRMREDFWEFTPSHKAILCTNHKPVIRGTDYAMWRRIHLVPFNVTIPEVERDKKLGEKLSAELPGILAWAVRGCLAWQRDGLGTPSEVVEATMVFRSQQDVLGQFMDECCHNGEKAQSRASVLYAAYKLWADENGERVIMSQRSFGLALTERGIERYKDGVMKYRGFAVNSEWVNRLKPKSRTDEED
jgi:putative DNA primase/helicase